jgi:hypothetical protein
MIPAGPVGVPIGDGTEPAGSLKTGGFLDKSSDLQFRKNACIVELVLA